MKFKIEHGIKIPPSRYPSKKTAENKYPFAKMQPGDSFKFCKVTDKKGKARLSVTLVYYKKTLGHKYFWAQVGAYLRVWRMK